MRRLLTPAILSLALLLPAVSVADDAGLWLHIRVTEDDDAKVVVNLPFTMIGKALPMIDIGGHVHDDSIHLNGHSFSYAEMRELWLEVREGPDMEFVTIEERGETVRIWKENGFLHVRARDERDRRRERVDVRMPVAVVDAFLSGEFDFDFQAAVAALASGGAGELVAVEGDEESVRVWIDRQPEPAG